MVIFVIIMNVDGIRGFSKDQLKGKLSLTFRPDGLVVFGAKVVVMSSHGEALYP